MSDKVIVSKTSILELIEIYKVPVGNSPSGELAAEWTMDAIKEIYAQIKTVLDQATPVSGEAVCKIASNGSQIHITKEDGSYFDMSKHVGNTLYTTPQPAPDTVPVERFNKLLEALEKANKAIRYARDNVSFADGKRAYFEDCAYYGEVEKALAEAIKGE